MIDPKFSGDLKDILDDCVDRINQPDFIPDDPISIPKRFSQRRDIEITAFWIAMLAWGQRKTIINKMTELLKLMDNAPHDFIVNHVETDRQAFSQFRHRTFQYTDCLYFLEFLQNHYREHTSLEPLFAGPQPMKDKLVAFHNYFFSFPHAPVRTRKHVATPARNSACKRLNMFLRWMVRKDNRNVDFGIWQSISSAGLMIPLDVHVGRVAGKLGLLKRKQRDWKAVEELTSKLREFDPEDPVKYDYALFGIGMKGVL